jgi:hypothetical protein
MSESAETAVPQQRGPYFEERQAGVSGRRGDVAGVVTRSTLMRGLPDVAP